MPTPRPGARVRGSRSGRPIMAALDLLGRRWALRILWELRAGALPFRALREAPATCRPRCSTRASPSCARRVWSRARPRAMRPRPRAASCAARSSRSRAGRSAGRAGCQGGRPPSASSALIGSPVVCERTQVATSDDAASAVGSAVIGARCTQPAQLRRARAVALGAVDRAIAELDAVARRAQEQSAAAHVAAADEIARERERSAEYRSRARRRTWRSRCCRAARSRCPRGSRVPQRLARRRAAARHSGVLRRRSGRG